MTRRWEWGRPTAGYKSSCPSHINANVGLSSMQIGYMYIVLTKKYLERTAMRHHALNDCKLCSRQGVPRTGPIRWQTSRWPQHSAMERRQVAHLGRDCCLTRTSMPRPGMPTRRRNYWNSGSSQSWEILYLGEDSLLPGYRCWIFRPNEHNGTLGLTRAGTKEFSRLWWRSWEQLSICSNIALQCHLAAHRFTEENSRVLILFGSRCTLVHSATYSVRPSVTFGALRKRWEINL